MFGFGTNEGVKTVRDRHFINIPFEIWVQSLNIYSFLGLLSDLRRVFINYAKVFWLRPRGGWKSVQCLSMADVLNLECFFDSFPWGSWVFSNIWGATTVCLTFPMVYNILLLAGGNFVPWDVLGKIWGCFTPLKQTCTAVYLKIFLKASLNPGK